MNHMYVGNITQQIHATFGIRDIPIHHLSNEKISIKIPRHLIGVNQNVAMLMPFLEYVHKVITN